MVNEIRVAIIGTGHMAAAHVEQYRKIEGVKVVSCFDIDAEVSAAFAKFHDIPSSASSVEELIDGADAVSIVTPDKFHAVLTRQVLAAEKHVLCEKPLTVTFDEAKDVAFAAKEASAKGIIHMVNFSYRSSAAFQEAIRLASSGDLGEIRHVHSYYLQQWLAGGNIDSSTTSAQSIWRLTKSGGVLADLGCHILDLTSAGSEDFSSLRCELRSFKKLVDGKFETHAHGVALEADDTALIEFELKSGGVGICHTSRWATAHGNHLRLSVHGTEGAFAFDLTADPNAIDVCMADDRKANPWGTTWIKKELAPTPTNWARFISSIRTGVQDQPDLIRGAKVQSYLDTCYRSASSGNWEVVGETFAQ